jgi:TusA-related sulfurtransferase
MAKTTRLKPHVTLDMKGAACPGPMLGAKRVPTICSREKCCC